MGNILKSIIYMLVTACSVTCLVYYLINIQLWDLYGYNLGFVLLVASIIYTGYMFIFELIKKPEIDQPIISLEGTNVNNPVHETNFMIDVFFKYLFSFAFAVLIFNIILLFRTNFEQYEKFPTDWYYIADIYVNMVLPVILLCDAMMNYRYRHHHYTIDITILFVLSFVHAAYKVLVTSLYYEQYKTVLPIISDYISVFLIAISGYTLYDYLLYKRMNPSGNYALFA